MKYYNLNSYGILLLSICAILLPGNDLTMEGRQDSTFVELNRNSVSYSGNITVTFRNIWDQDVWIFTSGCGLSDGGYLPKLTVEKKTDKGWETAGAPVCIAIATPHLILAPGESESVTFPVATGIEELNGEGWFRYRFDIRSDGDTEFSVSAVPENLRVSEAVKINR